MLQTPDKWFRTAPQAELLKLLADPDGGMQELRYRCRHCRSKLPVPVNNVREAFCARGCHVSFYRIRCRVCEAPIDQPKRGARLICKKAKCKNAWRMGLSLGRYHTSAAAESPQEVPVNKGPNPGISGDRASSWRIVAAGAPITANQYHCAIVGAAEAVAAVARTNAARWLLRRAAR